MLNEEREWPLLLRCLKREEVNDDKRFNTREGRAKNSLELMKILDEEFLSKHWSQLKELFEKSGVTFGSISEPYDHINDQQISDNELFTKFTDKEDLLTVDSPIFMKDEKKRKPQTAPEIGEHTRQILEELNYDKNEIDKLENKKIIRT